MMDESEVEPPHTGMIISVVRREDVVVTDPQRFLAAARRAYQAQDPDADDEEAARAVADVRDAVDALITEYGSLASEHPDVAAGATPRRRTHGGVGWLPGDHIHDRPDGLSPAGTVSEIRVNKGPALQDYGCFLPPWQEIFQVTPGPSAAKRTPADDNPPPTGAPSPDRPPR